MFGVAQNIGGRKRQEDSFGFYFCNASERQPFGTAQVFVIADGMGGRAGGDIASQLAVDGFIDAMRRSANWDKSALMAALTDANNGIARTVSARREFDGMGSTLLGVLHYRGMLRWVSVGDSPLWLYRRAGLIRLNEDHSMFPLLLSEAVKYGKGCDEVALHPRRHQLRSVVDGRPLKLVDTGVAQLERGDVVLAASDGIETLSVSVLSEILNSSSSLPAQELADLIVKCVNNLSVPHQDNSTAITFKY